MVTESQRNELLTAQRDLVALERDLLRLAAQSQTLQTIYEKAGKEYVALRDKITQESGAFDERTFEILKTEAASK